MPTGKPIAECLQGLGLLAQGPKPTKSQWTVMAKTVHGRITGLVASIEEEDRAGGHANSLDERIKDRTIEWVDKYNDLWTLKNRGSLFPHAPLYPAEKSIMTFWVEQLVRNKLDRADSNKKQGAKSLANGNTRDDNQVQSVTNKGSESSTQDVQRTSEASDEVSERAASPESSSHDEATSFNPSPAPKIAPEYPAAASIFSPTPTLQASDLNAIISYRSPDPRPTQADSTFQDPHPDFSPQNIFTSFAYPLVIFPQALFSQIIFLVRPSADCNRSPGRIMGLAEAQDLVNFRAGTLERLDAIGERIGSRRLVANLEWLPVPFLVQNSHDHHYLLETVKTWAEWKKRSLCVVYINLEDEA